MAEQIRAEKGDKLRLENTIWKTGSNPIWLKRLKASDGKPGILFLNLQFPFSPLKTHEPFVLFHTGITLHLYLHRESKKKLGGMEGGQCDFYLPCNTSPLLQHRRNSNKVSVKNRLITCSMQCRKKKVVKHKTTVGNELIADWHVWVDRISAQKRKETDWTRSTIFCFWEAQLAFYKHTSTNWSFTSTNTKDVHSSSNLQQASPLRTEAETNPIYGIKWELLHLAVPFQYFHQCKSEHRGGNCLGLPHSTFYRWPKGLGKKPSSSLNTIKTSSILSL